MINCIRQQKFSQEPSVTMQNRLVDSSTVTIWYNSHERTFHLWKSTHLPFSFGSVSCRGQSLLNWSPTSFVRWMLVQVHTVVVSPLQMTKLWVQWRRKCSGRSGHGCYTYLAKKKIINNCWTSMTAETAPTSIKYEFMRA